VKERKRLIFLGLLRKPIKPLDRACVAHVGSGHPLKKSWNPGQENELSGPWHSMESARKRERERERRTWGPKSLVEQGCFIEFCVSNIYRITM